MTEQTPKIRVDPELYKRAQVVAVIEGRTLKELTEEALRNLLSTKQVNFTLHPSLTPQVSK
jgi:predicted HicB family RNase H-like nuclease